MTNLRVTAQRTDGHGGAIEAGDVVDVRRSPGPPCDTMFMRLRRRGEPPVVLYLRPDEVLDIAWVCTTSLLDRKKET
jgi:hypothetical protein